MGPESIGSPPHQCRGGVQEVAAVRSHDVPLPGLGQRTGSCRTPCDGRPQPSTAHGLHTQFLARRSKSSFDQPASGAMPVLTVRMTTFPAVLSRPRPCPRLTSRLLGSVPLQNHRTPDGVGVCQPRGWGARAARGLSCSRRSSSLAGDGFTLWRMLTLRPQRRPVATAIRRTPLRPLPLTWFPQLNTLPSSNRHAHVIRCSSFVWISGRTIGGCLRCEVRPGRWSRSSRSGWRCLATA